MVKITEICAFFHSEFIEYCRSNLRKNRESLLKILVNFVESAIEEAILKKYSLF